MRQREALLQQAGLERVARGGRVPNPQPLDPIAADTALGQLPPSRRPGRRRELLAKPRGRDLVRLEQCFALALTVSVLTGVRRFRDGQARPRGERCEPPQETLTLSTSSTNLITSPPTPHPKQWKKPLSPLT